MPIANAIPWLYKRSSWTIHEQANAHEIDLIHTFSQAKKNGEVVKQNKQRTIIRLGDCFSKELKVTGPRAWFRELFRGAKAKLEFEKAVAIRSKGIETIQPIAWQGSRWRFLPGQSQIISRAVPESQPLSDFLDTATPKQKRQIATKLGQFFKAMFAAGVLHPDPHPGNFLVSTDEQGQLKLTLIDLHSVQLKKELSEKEIRTNLVLLNRWFTLRASRQDRQRFWNAFAGRSEKELARQIDQETLQSNLRFWQRRYSRYFTKNSEFMPIQIGDYHGMMHRSCPAFLLDELKKQYGKLPLINQNQGKVLKHSSSGTVIEHASGKYIFKLIPAGTFCERVKNLFRSSSVRKSWMFGQSVADRWLPTPRPLIMLHHYSCGMPGEGLIVMPKIEGAKSLHDRVNDIRKNKKPHQLLEIVEKLGRLIRQMHDRGVSHRDLKANNILFDQNCQPYVIDLVGVQTFQHVSHAIRLRDISRLAASFAESSQITHSIRLRFLIAYGSDNLKADWRVLNKLVRMKVQRNQSRCRVLA